MNHSSSLPVSGSTALLDARQPQSLEQAAALLRQDGLVAFPTDTVYGLGALVWNEASVAGIYRAKARPPEKAIPVLLAGVGQLALLDIEATPLLLALAERFWPGPLTLVVPCGARVPRDRHRGDADRGGAGARSPRGPAFVRADRPAAGRDQRQSVRPRQSAQRGRCDGPARWADRGRGRWGRLSGRRTLHRARSDPLPAAHFTSRAGDMGRFKVSLAQSSATGRVI
jgi:hypothetical protein